MFKDESTSVPVEEGETYDVTIRILLARETASPVSKAS